MKSQTELDDLALVIAELTEAERAAVLVTAHQFRIAIRQNTFDVLEKFVKRLKPKAMKRLWPVAQAGRMPARR